MGLMPETEEQAEPRALAPHELRALQALASADETLATARPFAGAADHWARDAREREAADAVPQRRAAPSPPSSPSAPFDGEAFGAAVVDAVKGYVERQAAPLLARISELEARLARTEGRLADVESQRSKRK